MWKQAVPKFLASQLPFSDKPEPWAQHNFGLPLLSCVLKQDGLCWAHLTILQPWLAADVDLHMTDVSNQL